MRYIYTKDVSLYNDSAAFARDYALMPAYRQKKIDGFKFQKDKNLSLGAGILLKEALENLGYDSDHEIIENENGKPSFRDIPDLYFSLSHSGERAMCVIANAPVGCDVQFHKDTAEINAKVAQRFYTEREQARDFYDVWALKESYIKALGLSVADDLKNIPSADTEDYKFELLDIEDNYSYAVCIHK